MFTSNEINLSTVGTLTETGSGEYHDQADKVSDNAEKVWITFNLLRLK